MSFSVPLYPEYQQYDMIAYKLDLVMLVLLPHDGMLLVDPGEFFCNYW